MLIKHLKMSFNPPELLYMFEFVIDDLVIIRKNYCAPEEYPTCVEFVFRSNVCVTICDREYGACLDRTKPMCGKCCIFPMSGKIDDDERLQISVYKKRSDCCKFLIGMAEMKVKPLFDYLNEIDKQETNWLDNDVSFDLPEFGSNKSHVLDMGECFDAERRRAEQLCPSLVNSKKMLPIFNAYNQQIGNIMLLLRLLCHGPRIVAEIYKKGTRMVGAPRRPSRNICYVPPAERGVHVHPRAYRYFAKNTDKLCPCEICEDELDRGEFYIIQCALLDQS